MRGVRAARLGKRDRKYYAQVMVMLALMVGVGKIPPVFPLTEQGMQVLGIFGGMLYGWSALDLIIPSLAGMVVLGMQQIYTMKEVFMLGFGDDLVLFILFFLVFATIVDATGVSNRIAEWFVSRKIGCGRPWVFSVLILLAAYVIGMAISLIATTIIMWNIFYKICEQFELKKQDPYVEMMIVGILLAAIAGYSIFPFKPLPALIVGSYEALSGTAVDFFAYIVVGFVISLGTLGGFLLYGCYVVKPNMDAVKTGTGNGSLNLSHNRMSGYQKVVLVTLISVFVLLLMSNILPADAGLAKCLRQFGSTGIVVVGICFLGLVQSGGEKYVDIKEMLRKGVQWDVCIMVAAIMPISQLLVAEQTGIMAFLSACFAPFLSGISAVGFVILMVTLCFILVQFVTNVAVAALMVPLMYGFAQTVQGVPEAAIVIAFGVCINTALLTPAASAQGAMLHSNSWIAHKSLLCHSSAIVGIVLTVILGTELFLTAFMP